MESERKKCSREEDDQLTLCHSLRPRSSFKMADLCLKHLKAGLHERRKHRQKRKEVHTSNANARTLKYAREFEYPMMADEVHLRDMELVFFILYLRLRYTGSHVRNANASGSKWKIFHFLRRCLRCVCVACVNQP